MKALVVGAGAIAKQHIGALVQVEAVDQVVVCDRSPATARAVADRFGLSAWTADFETALREIGPDVVHVTTPPSSHVALSRLALEAGSHVVVEKPAGIDPDDVADLVTLARSRDLLLVEDYNYLFNPSILRVLDDLARGAYGELVHVDVSICLDIFGEGSTYLDPWASESFRRMKGGPVADFLPHLASLVNAFVGRHAAVETLWTSAAPDGTYEVDSLRALVKGERATASLGFSPLAQPDLFSVTVEGTRQRSRTNLFEGRTSRERQRSIAKPLVPLANGLQEGVDTATGALQAFVGKLSGGPGAYAGLWTLLQRFYESLAGRRTPPVTLEQVLEVSELVRALTEELEPA